MAQMFSRHERHVDREAEQMIRFGRDQRRRQTAEWAARRRRIQNDFHVCGPPRHVRLRGKENLFRA